MFNALRRLLTFVDRILFEAFARVLVVIYWPLWSASWLFALPFFVVDPDVSLRRHIATFRGFHSLASYRDAFRRLFGRRSVFHNL